MAAPKPAVPRRSGAVGERLDQIGTDFLERSSALMTLGDLRRLVGARDELRAKCEQDALLREHGPTVLAILDLLETALDGSYPELSFRAASLLVFALHYLLEPADLIADSQQLLGTLDDRRVLKLCLELTASERAAFARAREPR